MLTSRMLDAGDLRVKLYGSEPPIFEIARRSPGLLLADLDDHFSEGELTGSRFFREVLVPFGIRHAAALLFWKDGALAAHIGIWRTPENGRFKEIEKDLLRTLHPYFDAAIHRVALIAKHELISSLLKEALEHPSDGMMLVDSKGAVVFQNQAAKVICSIWERGKGAAVEGLWPSQAVDLPEDVRRSAKKLSERFPADYHTRPQKGTKFETKIPHPGGLPVCARAQVIAPKSQLIPIHVRIEFSCVPDIDGQEAGLPVYRLTEGEHRVALLVARGMRNLEVATELGLSVNTVRAHLREVFSKLGLRHRGQIQRRLSDAAPPQGA